jgi:hypothetical protein
MVGQRSSAGLGAQVTPMKRRDRLGGSIRDNHARDVTPIEFAHRTDDDCPQQESRWRVIEELADFPTE